MGNPFSQFVSPPSLQVGVALKPITPVEEVLPYISDVDMVLVMTAEPGVKGQESVVNPVRKVETLRQKYPDLLIQTDSWEQPSREQVSSLKQEFINLILRIL